MTESCATRKHKKIEAVYKVTTPMFCAGADQREAELRVTSFKGVLRFWWRALAWSKYGGDLKTIKKHEDQLFGSSENGRGYVKLRLKSYSDLKSSVGSELGNDHRSKSGMKYLGYGVFEDKSRTGDDLRRGYAEPFSFNLMIRHCIKNSNDEELLLNSLKAIGMFSGIGSKNRKGFGSVSLKDIIDIDEKKQIFQEGESESFDEISTAIRELMKYCNPADNYPSYTAFSRHSRFIILERNSNDERNFGLDIINQIGTMLKDNIRGSGLGRIAFGLPRKFKHEEIDILNTNDKKVQDVRRASPLFIHVNRTSKPAIAVLAFLPSDFMYKECRKAKADGREISLHDTQEIYKPINKFLDSIQSENDYFSKIEEVKI